MYSDDTEIRQRIEKRFKARRQFWIHFSAYVVANLGLWGFWLLVTPVTMTTTSNGIVTTSTAMGFPWPLIVTVCWSIGIVAHFLNYYSKYGSGAENREVAIEREIERYRERVGAYEKPKNDRKGKLEINDDGETEDRYDDEASQKEKRG